jgi:hypothetical protein
MVAAARLLLRVSAASTRLSSTGSLKAFHQWPVAACASRAPACACGAFGHWAGTATAGAS